jgi:hypothetical protein
MRTMMKVKMDTAAASRAIADGSMRQVMQATLERLQPEAAYFTAEGGMRTAFIVFDLADTADIPRIAEPLFDKLNAKIDFFPTMNREDLDRGLAQLGSAAASGP